MPSLQAIIEPIALELLERYSVPGLVIAAARGSGAPERLVLGVDSIGRPLQVDSLFPVASITKLATALTVLRLIDSGSLALDDHLAEYVPEAKAAQDGVTIRTLLCHTSGAPEDLGPGSAPYTEGLSWRALAQACLRTPLDRPPLTLVRYSNVGYGLLAIVVERKTGAEFPSALKSLVLDPLGIEGYLGDDPPRTPALLADVRSEHAGSALEPFNSPFWRSLAFPWAGLVTTADGALALTRAFQDFPRGYLSSSLRTAATNNQTDDLSGGYGEPFVYSRCPWGLGPDLRGEKNPHWAPVEAGPDCFGHAGASGCVAWVSPGADLAWSIMGSRTADNGWLLRGTPAIGAALLETLGG